MLHLENVSISDNFFRLGGSSLQVIQVVSRIRRVFDVAMPVMKFFDNPTIEEMALLITELQAEQAGEGAFSELVRDVSNSTLEHAIGS